MSRSSALAPTFAASADPKRADAQPASNAERRRAETRALDFSVGRSVLFALFPDEPSRLVERRSELKLS